MFSLPWATTRPDQDGPSSQVHTHTHSHTRSLPPDLLPPHPGRIYPPPAFALLLPSLFFPPPPPHHHHDRLSLCNLSSRDPSSALSVACTSILFVPCVLSLLPFVDRIPLGAKFIRSKSSSSSRALLCALCDRLLAVTIYTLPRLEHFRANTSQNPERTETLTSFPSRSSTKIRSTLCGYYDFRSDREP